MGDSGLFRATRDSARLGVLRDSRLGCPAAARRHPPPRRRRPPPPPPRRLSPPLRHLLPPRCWWSMRPATLSQASESRRLGAEVALLSSCWIGLCCSTGQATAGFKFVGRCSGVVVCRHWHARAGRYWPSCSGRAGTRIVECSPDKPMLLISSSHEKQTAIKPRASRDREFYVNESQ